MHTLYSPSNKVAIYSCRNGVLQFPPHLNQHSLLQNKLTYDKYPLPDSQQSTKSFKTDSSNWPKLCCSLPFIIRTHNSYIIVLVGFHNIIYTVLLCIFSMILVSLFFFICGCLFVGCRFCGSMLLKWSSLCQHS